MDQIQLIRTRIELEFGVAPTGWTLLTAATGDEPPPRLLVSRFDGGIAVFFRHDLPSGVRQRLRQLGGERLIVDQQVARATLSSHAACDEITRVRWHLVERAPGRDECPAITRVDGAHAILVDGRIVSRAWSARDNDRAAEVEVETDPEHRRRGYARQVVASWAAHTLAERKIPFYSHLQTNTASAALAASLGLAWLSDDVEYQ